MQLYGFGKAHTEWIIGLTMSAAPGRNGPHIPAPQNPDRVGTGRNYHAKLIVNFRNPALLKAGHSSPSFRSDPRRLDYGLRATPVGSGKPGAHSSHKRRLPIGLPSFGLESLTFVCAKDPFRTQHNSA
jgi:hypothetical protein